MPQGLSAGPQFSPPGTAPLERTARSRQEPGRDHLGRQDVPLAVLTVIHAVRTADDEQDVHVAQ